MAKAGVKCSEKGSDRITFRRYDTFVRKGIKSYKKKMQERKEENWLRRKNRLKRL